VRALYGQTSFLFGKQACLLFLAPLLCCGFRPPSRLFGRAKPRLLFGRDACLLNRLQLQELVRE